MDLGLSGKRALVNAAAAGLGFAVASALAREGASVAISDLHLEHAQEAAARIAAETGASVTGFAADVADRAAVERLVGDAAAILGGLDVLVNNAGGPPTGDFDALDESHWERGYNLTLMSAIRRGICHMRGLAYVGNKLVMEAEMMAQIVKNNPA